MKMRILVFLSILLLPNSNLLMQEISDCKCPPLSYPPTGYKINTDSSLVIDTCGILYPSIDCDSVYWKNIYSDKGDLALWRVYSKKPWSVKFDVDAIPLEPAPWDTNLFVSWTAIDSVNYPEISNGFKLLEKNFGSYKLRKVYPDSDTGRESRQFILIFDDYAPVIAITEIIGSIEHTNAEFIGWPGVPQDTQVEINQNYSSTNFNIFPNPASDDIEITYSAIYPRVNPMVDGNYGIHIFDIYGKKMPVGAIHELPLRIDLSILPNGIYFLQIGNEFLRFIVIK